MTDDPPGDSLADRETAGSVEPVTVEELFSDLHALQERDADAETRQEVGDVEGLLAAAHERGLIDSGVRRLEARDVAQAFVGSVIFASPLLVEDGIFDIANYLFGFTVFGVPVFLLTNMLFVVVMTYALLEWTGRNREDVEHLFGIVPVRLLVVLGVSFVVATILMTVWGRVGGWQSPAEALARINVIWTVGSFGASLGDILPGESSGADLNDELATLGEGFETQADESDGTE